MMRSRMDIASALSGGAGFKLAAMAVAAVLGLMVTLVVAEASGDPYADASGASGTITGDPAGAEGSPGAGFVELGIDGQLTVIFTNNVAYDGLGDDLTVYVNDDGAPGDALIEVTNDGVTWIPVGTFSDAADVNVDLGAAGLPFATMVRISYVGGIGFGVDAVEALNEVDLEDVSIALAPVADTGFGFSEHLVIASVVSLPGVDDVPVPGVVVSFAVTDGPSAGIVGSATTDAAGQASFGWTGLASGLDEVTAWLDIDGSDTPDAGELVAVATKLWHGDTGTIELTDLNGDDLAEGDLIEVTVDDLDLDTTDGLDTIAVLVTSSPTDPAGISLLLTETGVHTGVFTGVVELSDVTDEGASQLAAAIDDVVTASYDDALDAAGADPVPVTASLTVVSEAVEDDDSELDEQHVDVCHIPGGDTSKQRTLTIGAPAVQAHLAHGDTEGECADAPEGESELEVEEAPSAQERARERKAARDEAFCERKGNDHPRCSLD